MNTVAATAWRLDFDGAELSGARPVDGGWQLRFAVVPAKPLNPLGAAGSAPGHALGVVLWLPNAWLEPANGTATTALPMGRCRHLQWWPADAPGPGAQPSTPCLPSEQLGAGRLQLEMAQGERLCWQAQGLRVLQPDGPRWLEHLHC